jgi:enterochelin esterase-like enzyme
VVKNPPPFTLAFLHITVTTPSLLRTALRHLALVALGPFLATLAPLRAQPITTAAPAREATLERHTFHAAALEQNPLGDPVDQPVLVYLPPAYAAEPTRRFPVVYLLHGLGMKPADWERSDPGRRALSTALTSAIHSGTIPAELIVVYANGANGHMGSLYMNSSIAGRWEDALVRDLVAWVDARYRTLPQAASRGVTGLSMGGFGALRFGFLHPDIFGAVYALSPAFIGFAAEFGPENPTMVTVPGVSSYADLQRHVATTRIRENYAGLLYICAAALSPNPAAKPLPIDYPFITRDGRLVPNELVHARWQAAMPLTMLDPHLANIRRLRAIGFDVGTSDHFRHIPVTVRALDRELTARGITHTFAEFPGGHTDRAQERLVEHALPFLAQHLLFTPEEN